MKRKLLFLCLLLLVFSLLLCSCGATPTPTPTPPDGPPDPPTPPETGLTLISEGETLTQIVAPSSLSKANADLIRSYIGAFGERGITLKKVEDYRPNEVKDCEILIGAVANRPDAVGDPREFGKEGYSIRIVDSRVVLTGGSDEAIADAIEEFFEYALRKLDDDLTLTLPENYTVIQPQTYTITAVTVGGVSISDFKILVDSNDAPAKDAASTVQSEIYDKTGIWLAITGTPAEHNLRVLSTADAGEGGFSVSIDEGGDLLLRCAYGNRFVSAVKTFLFQTIGDASGEVSLAKEYLYTMDVSKVYYSEFGAKGDGITDDFDAIIAAHNFANASGETVCADPGATYYIGNGKRTAIVKTDVEWGDAKFIIDDRKVPVNERGWAIFQAESDVPMKTLPVPEGFAPKKFATNVGMTFDRPCMLIIYCDTDLVYKRYGDASQADGIPKCDVLLVDEKGNVDPSTPIIWDYDNGVTKIEQYSLDDKPITLHGGTFHTLVNTQPHLVNGGGYERGVKIYRSHTTVDGLTHTVAEVDGVCGYMGFLFVIKCTNVVIKNSVISGRLMINGKNANYEIDVDTANDVLYYNVTQANDITDRSLWGVMVMTRAKNVVYDHCKLSRYDDHRGLWNGAIKDSEIGQTINLIGGGDFLVENTTVHNDLFLFIRTDYGASWEGTITIRNCVFVPTVNKVNIVKVWWRDFDPGYLCYFPNIVIDGLQILGNATVYFDISTVSETIDDIRHHPRHPYVMPEKITVSGLVDKDGKPMKIPLAENSYTVELFKDTEISEEYISRSTHT